MAMKGKDYAHAPNLLKDREEELRWKRQVKEEYPKQLLGYDIASVVSGRYKKQGIYPNYMQSIGLEKPDDPVPVRIATLAKFENLEDTNLSNEEYRQQLPAQGERLGKMFDESQAVLDKAQGDLRSLGVNVLSGHHVFRGRKDTSDDIYQAVLSLPLMKPSAKEGEPPQRDIDGAAIFLAYLLKHGFLEEKDIPKNEVQEGRMVRGIGFGSAILSLAKSPSIQAKIRSLDASPDNLGRQC